MMELMKLKALVCLIVFGTLITSCSKEDSVAQTDVLKVSNATALTTNDLLGHWVLSKMIADTEVDLNDDNFGNTNLLEETTCFNTMSITFKNDGTFISNNATMTFESGSMNNKFSCISDRIDSGNWEVSVGNLILTMIINGNTYKHSKAINLGLGTFSFDVNKVESNEYVSDPGNAQASQIRILALEYTKA